MWLARARRRRLSIPVDQKASSFWQRIGRLRIEPVRRYTKGTRSFLREHRVDQQDEIVAEPDAETGQEIAVLKKKSFLQKEGESSEL